MRLYYTVVWQYSQHQNEHIANANRVRLQPSLHFGYFNTAHSRF